MAENGINQLSIKEIKNLIGEKDKWDQVDGNTLLQLQQDQRKSVKDIYERIMMLRQQVNLEKQRLKMMFEPESNYWAQEFRLVAGIDEAGRGPLAGPVVAACVIFPHYLYLAGLNDSKKLTVSARASLEVAIKEQAIAWSIGLADHRVVDQVNIHQATFLAMKQALEQLPDEPELILIDGSYTIPGISLPQIAMEKGDQRSACIAAASILAKCARDRIMEQFGLEFPQYQFEVHKGYGTANHYEMINRYGLSPIHRRTFIRSESNKN